MSEKQTPYQIIDGQLILRDHLAADRTVLANERTFLAYIRTTLTLFVAGYLLSISKKSLLHISLR